MGRRTADGGGGPRRRRRTPGGGKAFLPGSGSAGRQAALRSQSAAHPPAAAAVDAGPNGRAFARPAGARTCARLAWLTRRRPAPQSPSRNASPPFPSVRAKARGLASRLRVYS